MKNTKTTKTVTTKTVTVTYDQQMDDLEAAMARAMNNPRLVLKSAKPRKRIR